NEPPKVGGPGERPASATTRRLSIPNREGGFGIGSTEVLIQVRGEMLTRLDGLVASWGQLSLKPELKRFRGRPTDKPFGEGARRMLRAWRRTLRHLPRGPRVHRPRAGRRAGLFPRGSAVRLRRIARVRE